MATEEPENLDDERVQMYEPSQTSEAEYPAELVDSPLEDAGYEMIG